MDTAEKRAKEVERELDARKLDLEQLARDEHEEAERDVRERRFQKQGFEASQQLHVVLEEANTLKLQLKKQEAKILRMSLQCEEECEEERKAVLEDKKERERFGDIRTALLRLRVGTGSLRLKGDS